MFCRHLPFEIKSFGHKSHWKGRSAFTPLLWLLWWNNRFPFNGNDLPHSSQAYGRSPVWQRDMWPIKCSLRVNGLLHTVHTCGLSPEWCFKWLLKMQSNCFMVAAWSYILKLLTTVTEYRSTIIPEMFFAGKTLVAVFTFVRRYSCVNHFMITEKKSGNHFRRIFTREKTLFLVLKRIILEMFPPRENFIAKLASMWRVSCVSVMK